MILENIEEIQSFDNKNFVHPWEYMKDVGRNKRMFAEKAEGVYLYNENGEKLIDGQEECGVCRLATDDAKWPMRFRNRS